MIGYSRGQLITTAFACHIYAISPFQVAGCGEEDGEEQQVPWWIDLQ